MSVIFIVLPLSIIVAGTAVLAFAACARRGQFDDMSTPPWRAIFDDEGEAKSKHQRQP